MTKGTPHQVFIADSTRADSTDGARLVFVDEFPVGAQRRDQSLDAGTTAVTRPGDILAARWTGVASRFAGRLLRGRSPSTSATATSACWGSPGWGSPTRAGAWRSRSASTASRSAARPRRSRRPRPPAPRRARLPLRRPARRPLPAPRRPARQRACGHRRACRDLRRGGDGQRRLGGRRPRRHLHGRDQPIRAGGVGSTAGARPHPPGALRANVTHSAMDNVGFLAAALASGVFLHSAGPADGLRVGRRDRPGHHRGPDGDRADERPA